MSMLSTITVMAGTFIEAEVPPNDGVGTTSLNPILPPIKELFIGSLASLIVLGALYKFAGPIVKQSFADRTARIQKDLDDSAGAAAAAEAEAEGIRSAKGDIDSERSRLYAEADAQAEALLADGRLRIDAEMADIEARAETELASAADRSGDELRAEIARYSSNAIDSVVNGTLDDATQTDLIESFITRVGSSTGASS